LWSIGVWSFGACLHAVCGLVTESWAGLSSKAELINATGNTALIVSTVSMWCFLVARCVLALGESGNFPSANKVNAEFFPKKDRAFALSIWNAGASIGAMGAPLAIPPLAQAFGWEMAFILIGALGFVWMGFWIFMYDSPEKLAAKGKFINKAELDYIRQDMEAEKTVTVTEEKKIPFLKCFTFKQTWAFAFGKFMTDGVWWFFLFWTPSYLKAQFAIKTTEGLGMALIFTLYAITTVLSIYGGKLPTIFINKTGANPYAARMKAMLIFAFFPLCVLLAQPLAYYFEPSLGKTVAWIPIILISLGCAAHQSWSANIFSTVGDMFPKTAIATITGIGGMAGGIGSLLIQKSAGKLFTFSAGTAVVDGEKVELTKELLAKGVEVVNQPMYFMGFEGKPAGYFIVFCFCAVAYLIGWTVMKSLVPKYKPITDF
jgi:ACS family hexuronate transporter-like MFS transporter